MGGKERDIKVGFIGCGWIVEHAHIPVFQRIEKVTLAAVYDVDKKHADSIADKYHIKAVSGEIEELFALELDAVVIATPNATHFQYAMEALSRGIAVLCEKPIVRSKKEMNAIIQLSKQMNCPFVPAFVNRFRTDVQIVSELLESKIYGEIIQIDAGWVRKNGIPRPGTWSTNKAQAGGGVLMDLGPHIIDVVLSFLKKYKDKQYLCAMKSEKDSITEQKRKVQWFQEERERKQFPIDVEDKVYATVSIMEKVCINLKLAWSSKLNGDLTYFRIRCENGEIILNTLFGFSDEQFWKNKCIILQNNEQDTVTIPLDSVISDPLEPFYRQASHFIEVISGEEHASVNMEDAARTVELIESFYQNEIDVFVGKNKIKRFL